MSDIKTTSHGKESGHWYNDKGLVLSVPNAKGDKMIKPTVRHAKKFGLLPSVTTVLGIVDKPNLTIWKCKEYVKSAFHVWTSGTLPKFESDIDFAEIDERNKKRLDYAEIGTDIHAEIGKWLESGMKESPANIVKHACEYLKKEIEAKPESSYHETEKPFANYGHGYGGTIDFLRASDDEVLFVDFKTCDDDKVKDGAKLAHKETHLAQLVAYDLGTNINAIDAERRYVNVFIGRFTGEVYIHEWTIKEEVEWARRYFLACLQLTKIAKGLE